MWCGKRKKSPNKHGTRSLCDIFTVQATVVNDDDRKLTARGEVPCVSLPVDEDDDGGPLPLEPATKEEVMDFDDDFSSETEFDEDSSSETEFDEDSSSETEFDEDAVDFDGNDTNVFFIIKPLDDAAKKAELILNETLIWMKKQDKGPSTESEKAYLVTLKSDLVDFFRLGYGLVFNKCKRDDLGCHVYEPQPMVGPASRSAGCYKVVQVAGGNNKGRVKTG
jgi:hypothetical protein